MSSADEWLEVQRASSLSDFMAVRDIRNACRSYMTNDPEAISRLKQARFWLKVRRNSDFQVFLFRQWDMPVGYGIIRLVDSKWWLTGGLVPEARGRGLGRTLFHYLELEVRNRGSEPWLEVLRSNRRAQRLYRALGYEAVYKTDDRWVMTK